LDTLLLRIKILKLINQILTRALKRRKNEPRETFAKSLVGLKTEVFEKAKEIL